MRTRYNRILGVDTRGSSICNAWDLQVWAPPESAQASAICDMIFHLLTESFPYKVRIFGIPFQSCVGQTTRYSDCAITAFIHVFRTDILDCARIIVDDSKGINGDTMRGADDQK
jgi:hypothetical protein